MKLITKKDNMILKYNNKIFKKKIVKKIHILLKFYLYNNFFFFFKILI